MSSWFRVYGELVDDPKFIKLGPDLRSALLTIWCIASKHNGRLPELEDVAIKFRLSQARTKKLLDELERCQWLDRDETGLFPHNWNGRQYKSDVSTERVKRFRKRHETVSETPPEQNRTDSTDTEQKERARGARLAQDWQPSDSDLSFAKGLGISSEQEIPKFRDYWFARAGPGAIKRDWSATWRNWCRRSKENGKSNGSDRERRKLASEEVLEHLRERVRSGASGDVREPVVRLLPHTGTSGESGSFSDGSD